ACARFGRALSSRRCAPRSLLPPLRDRPRDLALLATRMFDAACRRLHRRPLALTVAATQALFLHRWPGNVRELKNAMDYAAAAVPDTTVEVDVHHLPPAVTAAARDAEPAPPEPAAQATPPGAAPVQAAAMSDTPPALDAAGRTFRPIEDEIRELERIRMIEALAATGGVQNRAAELIQM